MPIVYTKIDLDDVIPLLKGRGYGFHSVRNYPLCLNKPSADPKQRSKTTGVAYREPLKPIAKADLDAILTRCDSAEEAAIMIERLSLGDVMSAVEEVETKTANGIGITADQIAEIIDNRVSMRVSSELGQIRNELADQRNEMAAILDSMRSLLDKAVDKAPKKKVAPQKKGTQKRTDAEVDEILSTMNLPPDGVTPPAA